MGNACLTIQNYSKRLKGRNLKALSFAKAVYAAFSYTLAAL